MISRNFRRVGRALGTAVLSLQIVDVELEQLSEHLSAMRARLLEVLLAAGLGAGVKVHGPRDPSLRLPNTLSIGIPGLEARVLLEKVGGE